MRIEVRVKSKVKRGCRAGVAQPLTLTLAVSLTGKSETRFETREKFYFMENFNCFGRLNAALARWYDEIV